MAMQHIQSQQIEASFSPQYFPVYGPAPMPEDWRTAWGRVLTRRPLMFLLLTGFGLYCLYGFWAANGYAGNETLYHWRCEILAGLLLSLTAFLFHKFRHWEQVRLRRAARRQEYEQELAAFLQQTMPAKPCGFRLEIEAWKSQPAPYIIEPDGSITKLPDARIAPDRLVLKLHLPSQP